MKDARQKAQQIVDEWANDFEIELVTRAELDVLCGRFIEALQEAAKVEWPTSKEREDWYSIYRSQFKGKDGYSSYNAIEAYESWLRSRVSKEG